VVLGEFAFRSENDQICGPGRVLLIGWGNRTRNIDQIAGWTSQSLAAPCETPEQVHRHGAAAAQRAGAAGAAI